MDFLSHLFLPLLVAYVLKPEWFESPVYLSVAVFGLLPDFDKFLGMPGMLHSLVTLVPIWVAVVAVEYWWRGRLQWSVLIVALVGSHLVLDFVDGGPVPLLYPYIKQGLGLQFPARTVFGSGPLGLVAVEDSLVSLRVAAPRPENRTYGFIKGAGVASMLAFVMVWLSWEVRDGRWLDRVFG